MKFSLRLFYQQARELLVGKPLNLMSKEAQKQLSLAALLAWIGLGADGLASIAYAPAQAYLSLGSQGQLSLYLIIATALTVFVLALGYQQIIELFPSGGGYQAATQLIGPYAGLMAGAALTIDYVLTIALCTVAGVEALASFLAIYHTDLKLFLSIALILLLMGLNLRGSKRSFFILMPIFLGFFLFHLFFIGYGIYTQRDILPTLIPQTLSDSFRLTQEIGWIAMAAFFLRAFSFGIGSYTGIETVANHTERLADPRVKTGKITLFYMALSLSLFAGGMLLLYVLWGPVPEDGQTLNAVVFRSVIEALNGSDTFHFLFLGAILVFEALFLLIAANTGLLGGSAILSRMSTDAWLPYQFQYLSSRLVTKNNLIVLSLAAIGMVWWADGRLDWLVILYAINIFLVFSLSQFGLCRYWIRHRHQEKRRWKRRLVLSLIAFLLASGILAIMLWNKFLIGGAVTVVLTTIFMIFCLYVRSHYTKIQTLAEKADQTYAPVPFGSSIASVELDATQPTAAILLTEAKSSGLYCLKWITERFPGYFHNVIFIRAATVDSWHYEGGESLEILRQETDVSLKYFHNYCQSYGTPSKTYAGFGTDKVDEMVKLCAEAAQDFPRILFFAAMLSLEDENWVTRLLDDKFPFLIQQALHQRGHEMVVLPMKV